MGKARNLSRAAALGLLVVGAVQVEASGREGLLELPIKTSEVQVSSTLSEPDAIFWSSWAATPLWFNETPSLYEDASRKHTERPAAGAQVVRMPGGNLLLRLRWSDASRNVQPSPWPAPDQGADRAGPKHTVGSADFADRACIMWPKRLGVHGRYPSLVMGERSDPVRMTCWTAGQGFAMLTAAGRGSVQPVEGEARGHFERSDDHWTVVFELPPVPTGTPLAIALWDGAQRHRDGLKFFSLWYQLSEVD